MDNKTTFHLTGPDRGWAARRLRTRRECAAYARQIAPHGVRGKVAEQLYQISQEAAQRRAEKPKPWLDPKLRPGYDYRRELIARRDARLLAEGAAEANRRRLWTPTCSPNEASLWDYDPQAGIWLMGVEKKYHYSNRFGDWWVRAAWLCGRDEGRTWAVRVPGTMASVAEALDWLTPAEVKRAQAEGRQVIRQGDVYFIQKKRRPDNLRALRGTRHSFDPETRVVTHPEHRPVHLPWPAKAIRQTQLASSSRRTWRRGGD